MTSLKTGPLAGIRVIEMDAIGPVPLAAMVLADLGADIVRVARPPSVGGGAWEDVGGDILHRGRAVTHLNLKDTADRDMVLELIGQADALIEGFRPGVMERIGLGPDTCLARNPRLVYGRMTGWGQSGPMALRAGHDINYLSLTGALHAMGGAHAPPPVPLNLVGDYGGGAMFLVSGVLSAIICAIRTGQGQVVDASISDGVPLLMSLFYAWLPKGLWSDAPASNLLDGAAPFYRCYRCADGRDIAIGCLEPQFFAQAIKLLGLERRGYIQNNRTCWPAMEADFAAIFATRSRDEWGDIFAETDACITPVLSMTEAPSYPHNATRSVFVESGGIIQPSPAPRMSATPPNISEPETVEPVVALHRWLK
ncbi:Alpha-methylacyl-CoA racemase [Sphingobium indicum BiD32]|uniref:Alpha-methylacyl-CoA racemase n=1 Tax=Sphingobium indicum BiD32 TaxID=1301087 RepID=N1MX32_9SPHN|nr:CaiB/BaiF CoA-transferase family protein [Sphingobium indicum]CCW19823.1 Alpha-methylacyl-CoA racemase [Sphingobium indicum BiD32]